MSRSFHINIKDDPTDVNIDASVYRLLHENFIFSDKIASEAYLSSGKITFVQLRKLSRENNFSYAMFFVDKMQLLEIIEKQNKALYGSIDNKEIIAGSRTGATDIRAIRWIIADLMAKKALYKQYGNNKKLDKIVKFLISSRESISEQSDYILKTMDIVRENLWKIKSKKDAYKVLCRTLSDKNVHVYTEAKNCMPQNIPTDVDISGLYIRDNFNPIIFICNEISGHPDEGMGRKIYTLVFLLVSIYKGQSFAISISNGSYTVDASKSKDLEIIHKITNEILMPEKYFIDKRYSNKEEIINESAILKVTPTALLVRLRDLKKLDCEYKTVKNELTADFERYVAQKREEKAEARRRGDTAGPTPRTMYKSYQGDFVDFIKTKVPEHIREQLFKKHIVYGRTFIVFGDL